MTPTELRALGDKHGHGWQTRLARAVPVNVRTVRRYLSGKMQIRPVVEVRIRQVFAEWTVAFHPKTRKRKKTNQEPVGQGGV